MNKEQDMKEALLIYIKVAKQLEHFDLAGSDYERGYFRALDEIEQEIQIANVINSDIIYIKVARKLGFGLSGSDYGRGYFNALDEIETVIKQLYK